MGDPLGKILCDDIDRNVVARVGTPVRLNWRFLLIAGRLEITYNGGAQKVVDHGTGRLLYRGAGKRRLSAPGK